eukprot:276381_1
MTIVHNKEINKHRQSLLFSGYVRNHLNPSKLDFPMSLIILFLKYYDLSIAVTFSNYLKLTESFIGQIRIEYNNNNENNERGCVISTINGWSTGKHEIEIQIMEQCSGWMNIGFGSLNNGCGYWGFAKYDCSIYLDCKDKDYNPNNIRYVNEDGTKKECSVDIQTDYFDIWIVKVIIDLDNKYAIFYVNNEIIMDQFKVQHDGKDVLCAYFDSGGHTTDDYIYKITSCY